MCSDAHSITLSNYHQFFFSLVLVLKVTHSYYTYSLVTCSECDIQHTRVLF